MPPGRPKAELEVLKAPYGEGGKFMPPAIDAVVERPKLRAFLAEGSGAGDERL